MASLYHFRSWSTGGGGGMYRSSFSVSIRRVSDGATRSTNTRPTPTPTPTPTPKPKLESSHPSSSWSTNARSRGAFLVASTATAAFVVGYGQGRKDAERTWTLPPGGPRTCCDGVDATLELADALRAVVLEPQRVRTNVVQVGARLGHGTAEVVVRPSSLAEAFRCVEVVMLASSPGNKNDHEWCLLPQGRNTGLTGGSVPRDGDDRPTVVLDTSDLTGIYPVDNGEKIFCLAGTGIADVNRYCSSSLPQKREGHSVLGSTFLNPTVAAGVSLGSGGTRMRVGPAYTDRALYLQVNDDGHTVRIVNTLDLEGTSKEQNEKVLDLLDQASLDDSFVTVSGCTRRSSDSDYAKNLLNGCHGHVHDHNHGHQRRVSRCNADTHGCDANRSEGKVVLLATVHDTYPAPKSTETFFLSFDSLETALDFRREVALPPPPNDSTHDSKQRKQRLLNELPIAMEYMDRDAFDVVDEAGRAMALVIRLCGRMDHPLLRKLWDAKTAVEACASWMPFAEYMPDMLLYGFSRLSGAILPPDLMEQGKKYDHHLMVTVGEFADSDSSANNSTLQAFRRRLRDFTSSRSQKVHGAERPRSEADASSLQIFRFVAAPAFRTWCVGTGHQGFSVDYALPVSGGRPPPLDSSTSSDIVSPQRRMVYGHFGCQVVHEDLAYGADVDHIDTQKYILKAAVERHQGVLPAEHGHGTEYVAPASTQQRWKRMDPSNRLNPGIGGLPATSHYK